MFYFYHNIFNKIRNSLVICMVCSTGLMLNGFSLKAQDMSAGGASRTISLDEAIRLGLAQSKLLKVSGLRNDATASRVKQLVNVQYPALTLGSTYTRLSNNITPFTIPFNGHDFTLNPQILNQFTNRVGISQVVFAGFRAQATLESSRLLAKAASLDYDRDKAEVINTIITAYYAFYKAQLTRGLVLQNIETSNARLQDTKNLAKNGLALDNDVVRVELSTSNLQQSVAEIESAISVSNYNMNLMLGLPENTIIKVDESSLYPQKSVLPLASYMDQSAQKRPDLLAADYRMQSYMKTQKVVRGNYYPVLSVGANFYENRPNQRVFPNTDAFKETFDAGLSLSWNFTTFYTNKEILNEARINIDQAAAQKDQLSDAARMEINANYSAYLLAQRKIELSATAVRQSTENQRVTKNRYAKSVALLTDLLDADVLLLQAQVNQANARIDAETAYQKLLKSAGMLNY